MAARKKVVWNQGQVPDRYARPKLPSYTPPQEIFDTELKDAWFSLIIGGMLITTEPHFVRDTKNVYSGENIFPHPLMYRGPGSSWAGDVEIPTGSVMVYLGSTNVDCLANKGRIISRPYPTVFYNGIKYLIQDQNCLKPLSF